MNSSKEFYYLTIYAFVVSDDVTLVNATRPKHAIRELTVHPIKQSKRSQAASLNYISRSSNPLYVINISDVSLDGVQLADITMEMSPN